MEISTGRGSFTAEGAARSGLVIYGCVRLFYNSLLKI